MEAVRGDRGGLETLEAVPIVFYFGSAPDRMNAGPIYRALGEVCARHFLLVSLPRLAR